MAAVIGGALVVAWVAGAVVVAGRFTDAFIVRQVADLTAIRSLEAQVPPGARLVSMGPTGVFVRDGVPDVVELFDLDPAAAAALLADGRPSYLVIDPGAIAGQWAGRGPAADGRSDPGEPWAHPDRRSGRVDALSHRVAVRGAGQDSILIESTIAWSSARCGAEVPG